MDIERFREQQDLKSTASYKEGWQAGKAGKRPSDNPYAAKKDGQYKKLAPPLADYLAWEKGREDFQDQDHNTSNVPQKLDLKK